MQQQKNNGKSRKTVDKKSARLADFIYNRAWLMLEKAELKGNAAMISKAKEKLADAFKLRKAMKNGSSVHSYYLEKWKEERSKSAKPDFRRILVLAAVLGAAVLLVLLLFFAAKGIINSCAGNEPQEQPSASDTPLINNTDDLGIYKTTLDRDWLSFIELNDYSVYIRSGPGVEFEQIAQCYRYQEESFIYLGESYAADGSLWYHIETENGTEGWVSAEFTKKIYKIPDELLSGNEDIDYICEKYDVVGAQIALVENGSVKASYSYGWAVIGEEKMTENTVIRTASLSRIPLGACALMLADRGKISLEEDISPYWSISVRNPGWPSENITLSQLLTDTSSLVYHDFAEFDYEDIQSALSKSTAFEKKYRPGTSAAWAFSNFNAGVAGATLEVAANEPLHTFSQRELFRKLGINASFISGELTNAEFASLYNSDHSLARSAYDLSANKAKKGIGQNAASLASGFCCSAQDFAKLLSMLKSGGEFGGERFISEESYQRAWQQLYTAKEYSWSFKQTLLMRYTEDTLGCDGLYYICGNAYGALCLACVDENSDRCVVVLTTGAFEDREDNGIYSVCAELAGLLLT